MDKKEFVNSFIDTLRQGDNDKLYKFFTSRTVVFKCSTQEIISLDDFISYLKTNLFNQDIEVKRVFESAVCVKVEIVSKNFEYEAMIIEIESRRIKRIELF